MMTPQELLRIAKNINPQKLEKDPQAALEDAYIVYEAFRLAELEKVSEPNFRVELEDAGPLREEPKVTGTLYLPKESSKHYLTEVKERRAARKKSKMSTVECLTDYYQHHSSGPDIAKKLKVSLSTFYNWIKEKNKPTADSIAKIEAFLTNEGYYE